MRLHIRHETKYVYDSAPSYAVQRLCLTPVDFDTQKTIVWRIEAPGIDKAFNYQDGFGNRVHVVTSASHAMTASILAEGIVETQDTQGIVRGLPPWAPDAVFLRQTLATRPNAGMKDIADGVQSQGSNLIERLHALMNAIHARVAYELGATHVHTTAAEAFDDGRGVCQDHAHIFTGIARHLGIPSRYVTGYLATEDGEPATASHAWAEALVPGLGWIGFDPANATCPTEYYVRVAGGIDAASIAPIRGTRRGGMGENMTVEVRVETAEQ
jgi:transglutaminase-like putative cysteine protease